MTEQKRKIVVYVIFVLAIIYGVANLYPKSTDKEHKSNLDKSAQLENAQNIIAKYADPKLFDTLSLHTKSWGSDPFQVLHQNISKKTYSRINAQLVLSGILYNKNNPVAIINKKTLRVGDKIENAKIIKINRRDVIIKENGKNITLTISKG